MSYIDTCVVLMFVNRKDILRRELGVNEGSIKSILKGSSFCIPMAALGESIHMIREKNPKDYMPVINELMELLDAGFLNTRFMSDSDSTFMLARRISATTFDDRDRISPMDAFITASATTDQTCTALYTSDSKLLSDANVSRVISEWRESQSYPNMIIRDVSELFGNRFKRR